MPKISPRREVLEHPLYRTTMAAQHLAYQLMRDVPPEHKAAAARLHGALVHATTYATFAVDPSVADKEPQLRGLAASAATAKELLPPLSRYAKDGRDVEVLGEKLDELTKAASPASSSPG